MSMNNLKSLVNLDLLVGQFHGVLIAIDMDFPINFNHDLMT